MRPKMRTSLVPKILILAIFISTCLLLLRCVPYGRHDSSTRLCSNEGRRDHEKSVSGSKKPLESPRPKSTTLNSCQQNVYSREELSRMCSHEVKSPKCLVTQLHHLEQKAFIPAKLRLSNGSFLKIFVNPTKDAMAGTILRDSGWEQDSVNLVLRALRASTGAALIDIGCNFGVYSLAAAAAGHQVVCVEASHQIAMRLRKSAKANGLTNRMNVFWNALSANREQIKLRYPTDCNLSLLKTYDHRVRRGGQQKNIEWVEEPVLTDSIGLDDVTVYNSQLKGIRNLIIKVDIEGSEWNVFATAAATFEKFNIGMVLMEWEWTAVYFPKMTLFITRFFTSRGFAAYGIQNGRVGKALSVENRLKWPADVLWIREQSGLQKVLLK